MECRFRIMYLQSLTLQGWFHIHPLKQAKLKFICAPLEKGTICKWSEPASISHSEPISVNTLAEGWALQSVRIENANLFSVSWR